MWLKVERLVSIHIAVVQEVQTNLRDFLTDPEVEDNWLEASPADMEKIRDLVQEILLKPTANLADLMYKSVEIRDSRHSLQLNTSMYVILSEQMFPCSYHFQSRDTLREQFDP